MKAVFTDPSGQALQHTAQHQPAAAKHWEHGHSAEKEQRSDSSSFLSLAYPCRLNTLSPKFLAVGRPLHLPPDLRRQVLRGAGTLQGFDCCTPNSVGEQMPGCQSCQGDELPPEPPLTAHVRPSSRRGQASSAICTGQSTAQRREHLTREQGRAALFKRHHLDMKERSSSLGGCVLASWQPPLISGESSERGRIY